MTPYRILLLSIFLLGAFGVFAIKYPTRLQARRAGSCDMTGGCGHKNNVFGGFRKAFDKRSKSAGGSGSHSMFGVDTQ